MRIEVARKLKTDFRYYELGLLLEILICRIFVLESARRIGILVPLFVMSISLTDPIVMKMLNASKIATEKKSTARMVIH